MPDFIKHMRHRYHVIRLYHMIFHTTWKLDEVQYVLLGPE